MEITLFDINPELCREWGSRFYGESKVTVINASYQETILMKRPHCVVSPANSFGIMDGGLDLVLREAIPGIQEKVTKVINDTWRGFLPPNDCSLVRTGAERNSSAPQWLAIVPTMAWPMGVPYMTPYFAMRGLLAELYRLSMQKRGESIRSVAIPGLATTTGKVPAKVAAEMMYLAYKHHYYSPTHKTWESAAADIREIKEAVHG